MQMPTTNATTFGTTTTIYHLTPGLAAVTIMAIILELIFIPDPTKISLAAME